DCAAAPTGFLSASLSLPWGAAVKVKSAKKRKTAATTIPIRDFTEGSNFKVFQNRYVYRIPARVRSMISAVPQLCHLERRICFANAKHIRSRKIPCLLALPLASQGV